MGTIRIDDRDYSADPAKNLLEVCLSHGLDLPYFCWHPALGSVGACRQCAVKQFRDADDSKGRLVMACMTPADDGTRISIEDPDASELRASVIEWLMVNHPHDCPVCDEGGECHLQDMTVMTGHRDRRFRFPKRTYRNQDLGPLINHEMNRCIQCYRCVRFYGDYAGGRDLQAFGAHDHVYFGRHQDGTLESEFAGNLVEICPTGVFTDKTLKSHYTRKWDLQTAPSVCVHCALGCNTTPGERYGELRRVRSRYHGAVNGYFLCDRGRYGYEFVNSERRLRAPLAPKGSEGAAERLERIEALERAAALIDPARTLGIGSPRASLEANWTLRALVGAERFVAGASAEDGRVAAEVAGILRSGSARSASLREVESCDAVLVLGEDPTTTAPLLALALRQAARQTPLRDADALSIPSWDDSARRGLLQDDSGPFFIASPSTTRLDDVATEKKNGPPEELARLGLAVAHAIDPEAPQPAGLDGPTRELAARIGSALSGAERPLVVAGCSAGIAVVQAAANVAAALTKKDLDKKALGKKGGDSASLFFTLPECNSLGLALLGGQPLAHAFDAVERGAIDTLVVLENDLFRRASAATVARLLTAVPNVVVLDHIATETAARADLVLPSATFAEADGTLVNNEGRAQRSYQVFVPEAPVQESWRWLRDVAEVGGHEPVAGWHTLEDVQRALAASDPVFASLLDASVPADYRQAGARLPRALHRYSGRTAMLAHHGVHEPKPPEDSDSPLSFSMEGYDGVPPARLVSEFWSPGWNSIQALNRFQEEIGGPLRGGDPGVRLLEPDRNAAVTYFDSEPAPFERRDGEWRLVSLHHTFGSEELSVLAPGIAELAPAPYLALHPDDAAALGLDEGAGVVLDLGGDGPDGEVELPLRLDSSLARGVAGLPRGLPDLPAPDLPEWARLRRASA